MAQQAIAIHPTLSRIRVQGYWRTIIRPSQFEQERISDPQLLARIVEQNATHFRGWEFPSSSDGHGNDWVDHALSG